MQVEYRKKIDEYSKNQENWTDLVKQAKLDEIQSMERRIQAFQESAQESLQQDYNKLLQPVIEKANKAVEAVAKEQGITYVITGDSQVLIYKAVGTLDLLPAVKKHLGIKD
jgi:outer membrane protein